jgi:hypothetical protein
MCIEDMIKKMNVYQVLTSYIPAGAAMRKEPISVGGQDKMSRMKAILEKAEQHLSEKVGQYSEKDKSSPQASPEISPPESHRPELQEGISDTANAFELFDVASNSMASSDSGKYFPVAVRLTVDHDFDQALRDVESTAEFSKALQNSVSSVLGVPTATVLVLCHQRGSIMATVLLMGDEEDVDAKPPSELAQKLVDAVGLLGEGLQKQSFGWPVKKVEFLGRIDVPVCKAVQGALEGSQARRLAAATAMSQEAAAAKKQEAAMAKRFNFMYTGIMDSVDDVESIMSGLSNQLRSREMKESDSHSVVSGTKSPQRSRSVEKLGLSTRTSGQAVELNTGSEELEEMLAGSQEALKASALKREQDLMKRLLDLEAENTNLRSQSDLKQLEKSQALVQELEQRLQDSLNSPRMEATAKVLIERMATAQDSMLAQIADLNEKFRISELESIQAHSECEALRLALNMPEHSDLSSDPRICLSRRLVQMQQNERNLQKDLDVLVSTIEASSRSANIAMLKVTEQVLEMKGQALQMDSLIGKRNVDEVGVMEKKLERVSAHVDNLSARLTAKDNDLQTKSDLYEVARVESDQLRSCIAEADAESADLKMRLTELKNELINFRGRSMLLQHRKDIAIADLQRKIQGSHEGVDDAEDQEKEKGSFNSVSSAFSNFQEVERQMGEVEERRKCQAAEMELEMSRTEVKQLEERLFEAASRGLEKEKEKGSQSRPNLRALPLERQDQYPVAVALTVSFDFDEALGDSIRAAAFNQTLQTDVSSVLSVPESSVKVLCHQRGSVIAEIVLFADNDDESHRTPADLAQALLTSAETESGSLRKQSIGKFITKVEVHGPIAAPVCNAVLTASRRGVVGAFVSHKGPNEQVLVELRERLAETQAALDGKQAAEQVHTAKIKHFYSV